MSVEIRITVGDGKTQTFKSTKDSPMQAFDQAREAIRAAAVLHKAERAKVQQAADEREQQAASYKRAGRELVATPDPARAKGKGS